MSEMLDDLKRIAAGITRDRAANPARSALEGVIGNQFAWSPETGTAVRKLAEAILAAGYLKPRTITTAAEIRELPALTIVVYDDTATGGLLQTYVVPDDGTVMFKDREPFHLMTFAGDYIDSEDMPLPLTAVYEVRA